MFEGNDVMTTLCDFLKKNRVLSIRQPSLYHILGHIPSVLDEGTFIRIEGTYIVDKKLISSVKVGVSVIRINYNNGKWVELFLSSVPEQQKEVPAQPAPPTKGFSKKGRKLGRPKGS